MLQYQAHNMNESLSQQLQRNPSLTCIAFLGTLLCKIHKKTSVTAPLSEDETSENVPKFVHVLQDMLESSMQSLPAVLIK